MAWQTIWHDTDKLIERDDVTEEERITWLNPNALEARLVAAEEAVSNTENELHEIVTVLAAAEGVEESA